MTVAEFVTDKHGFVDPEKIEAVDLYGLDKAREMWANGKPDWKVRTNLQKLAFLHYMTSYPYSGVRCNEEDAEFKEIVR